MEETVIEMESEAEEEEKGEPIMRRKFDIAMKNLKKSKVFGMNAISPQLIKNGGQILTSSLYYPINNIYKHRIVPKVFEKSKLVS